MLNIVMPLIHVPLVAYIVYTQTNHVLKAKELDFKQKY
jgi:hypothetical protein